MKNKKLLCALLSALLVTGSITALTLVKQNKENIKEPSSLVANPLVEKGIKITSIKESNSTNYGVQKVTYTITPEINNDQLLYKCTYTESGQLVEDGVIIAEIAPSSHLVIITCLKPFTKQITFTLYAASDENVNASITLDFKERVYVDPLLVINEGKPLKINPNVTSTGGSIPTNKNISSYKITYNEEFVSRIKDLLMEKYETSQFTNPQTTNYYRGSEQYFGLDHATCSYFFSTKFTYQEFIEKIYFVGNYSWIESDSDYETEETITLYATDLDIEDYQSLFDGVSPVFDYTYTLNGTQYVKELGLSVSNINITQITLVGENYIF